MIKVIGEKLLGKEDMKNPEIRKLLTKQICFIFNKGWADREESHLMMRLGPKNCITLYNEGR